MRKILITGAKGMLATDLNAILNGSGTFEVLNLDRQQLDITDPENVEKVFTQFNPQVIIHTAALTNVDYCEEDKEEAYRINGCGTQNIASYSDRAGAKFVYISSCGLFGDEIKEYTENDPVVLKTEYAKSKYMGEQKTRETCEKHFIVRPGWLFGGSINHKKNFVYNRYLEAKQKPQIQSAGDKYGCPTNTNHLALKILELIDTDLYGTYHISNSSFGTRFDYVKKIIDSFGIDIEVVKVDSNSFKRSAPVPDCEIIKNSNLERNGFSLLPDWRDAVEEYVHRLKKEIE
ncbi:MAG: NAD(P)-dependent oxidoreductase [Clostridia bacterium]|nr:NAD(P)-dependent oxidoreductase [Clostridia bacterium]